MISHNTCFSLVKILESTHLAKQELARKHAAQEVQVPPVAVAPHPEMVPSTQQGVCVVSQLSSVNQAPVAAVSWSDTHPVRRPIFLVAYGKPIPHCLTTH